MPASYRVDTVAGIVFITHSGRLTDQDILTNQQRLRNDPQFLPTLDHLVDARGVTERAITAHGVHALANANIYAPGSRRAIVVSDDVIYGYTRMFQILRDKGPEEIRIFRSLADARRWLGLAEQPPDDRSGRRSALQHHADRDALIRRQLTHPRRPVTAIRRGDPH